MTNKNPPLYRIAGASQPPTVAELLLQQKQIRTKAPGSPLYSQVQATLTAWNGSTDAMANLMNQVAVIKQQLGQANAQLQAAHVQFTLDQRSYKAAVVIAARGVAEAIEGLGYAAVTGHAPAATSTPAPTGLVATPGVDPGSVHLVWQAAKGKHTYAVQLSPDPVTATSWSSLPGTSRRRLKLGDLTPGARYWVRVAIVGAAGQSPYCAPVAVTAR